MTCGAKRQTAEPGGREAPRPGRKWNGFNPRRFFIATFEIVCLIGLDGLTYCFAPWHSEIFKLGHSNLDQANNGRTKKATKKKHEMPSPKTASHRCNITTCFLLGGDNTAPPPPPFFLPLFPLISLFS
ncbi:hypothetical protein L209DRAFT_19892 [Thermothelomyces heterothallicus CBS 203.75]